MASIDRTVRSVLAMVRLTLTEPFGQDMFSHDDAMRIDRRSLHDIYRSRDSPEKMNQWLHWTVPRSASSAMTTARSAGRFWTAHAKCSWTSALTAPAWAR